MFPAQGCSRGLAVLRVASTCSSSALPRHFGSRGSAFGKNRQGTKFAPPPKIQFKTLLLKFYRIAHPDTMRASFPKCANVNDSSFQVLNGILDSVKTFNSYPARMQQSVNFYVKVNGSAEPQPVQLQINTPGGDCRKVFQRSFQHFFTNVGVLEPYASFEWGEEYFPNEQGTIADNKYGHHDGGEEEDVDGFGQQHAQHRR